VDELRYRLGQEWETVFEQSRGRVQAAADKLRLLTPRETLRKYDQQLAHLDDRLGSFAAQSVRDCRGRLKELNGRLIVLSPKATLQRGYSITRRAADGQLIKSVKTVNAGDAIKTTVADGEFTSEVV
jgi:exodeoxyribonuclease VII large subunit